MWFTGGTQISSILAGGCSVNTEIFSHHAGELLAGLSTMYQSTNDIYYLSEAHEVFAAIQNQFTSSESINIEPACQGGTPQDSKKCPSPSGYYWPLYKGLTILYQATFRSDIQNSIARLIQTSARTNFALCRPDWNCMRNMGPSFGNVLRDGTNVRDQFESVALLNALAALNNGPSATVMPTQTSAATRTADKGNGSGFSPVPPTVYIGSAVIAALVLVIFTGFAIYAKLNKPPNYLDESFGLPDDPTPFLINSK
ncbi:hypothetical protein BDR26DRAFT_725081 [Obelidium mucronatum]|nr:hypothetical protein BDR26DRAFT_725081 [Obelidium mucronatum]